MGILVSVFDWLKRFRSTARKLTLPAREDRAGGDAADDELELLDGFDGEDPSLSEQTRIQPPTFCAWS